jgi:site-specific DNA-methyltransferase (adenine-specific)
MLITLNQGDCLGEDGMKTLANRSVDMICCDLPYGITDNPWDSVLDLSKLFAEYLRIIKDDGAIVLFSCQPFTTDLMNVGRKYFRYELIWSKSKGTDFFNSKKKPLRSHENILVFSKKGTVYNPQMTEGKPYTRKPSDGTFVSSINKTLKWVGFDNPTGLRFPKTVLEFKREQGKHTTQKPVPLIEWLVKTYTNEGDLVVDNTMGSGTCAVACINNDRKFIGWEFDEKIYGVAKARVEKAMEGKGGGIIVSLV